MKTLSFYLVPIILSLGLSNLSPVAAESDENSQRCNSLPFSLEGVPETGPDPNVEYKGKLIDGITHVFYPSGRLQRRGKRIDDNGNLDINGKRSPGVWEVFDEECYLVTRITRNNNGVNLSGEFFDKGLLTKKDNYRNGKLQFVSQQEENELFDANKDDRDCYENFFVNLDGEDDEMDLNRLSKELDSAIKVSKEMESKDINILSLGEECGIEKDSSWTRACFLSEKEIESIGIWLSLWDLHLRVIKGCRYPVELRAMTRLLWLELLK